MALAIRCDRSPEDLRRLAKSEGNARVACRLLAIANALSGMSQQAAVEAAGMDRQTLRDWVIRYNDCPHCPANVEGALRQLEGVSDAHVNLGNVAYDSSRVKVARLTLVRH